MTFEEIREEFEKLYGTAVFDGITDEHKALWVEMAEEWISAKLLADSYITHGTRDQVIPVIDDLYREQSYQDIHGYPDDGRIGQRLFDDAVDRLEFSDSDLIDVQTVDDTHFVFRAI